ncbi:MAG: hypothetical protein K0Q87_1358 [Neobacillus sp.]|jgi:hypothetical protein|nr:hypothetical protein [Neobacillus sp.]
MIAAAGIQNVSVKSEQKQTDQIPERGKLQTKKSLLIRRVTRVRIIVEGITFILCPGENESIP